MAKNETSITPDTRKGMPSRGKNKRTLIIEALKKSALNGLGDNATAEECEKAWFGLLVRNAMDNECKDSGLCLRLITERGWSALKPSSELIEFEFDKDADLATQSAQILKAVSDGVIPMDYGNQFISAISSMVGIEESTTLKAEIERIKEKLGLE